MAEWHFRELAIGEKIREPIQGEFFSTEAIKNPADALVRESIQNSLDAGTGGVIRIRIFLGSGRRSLRPELAKRWFSDAWKHFRAPGNGLMDIPEEDGECPFLVVEDFGTSGLEGDETEAFEPRGRPNPFFYFFRAEGRSSKSESDRGRWGVGKFVFPRSSRISSLYGLTVRGSDQRHLLMGQVVLKSHHIKGRHYSPDGSFGHKRSDGLVLPVYSRHTIDDFRETFQIRRTSEPGLSVVIPYIDEEISASSLIEAVVREYLYPILEGKLEVEVDGNAGRTMITADSLPGIAENMDTELKSLVELANFAAFAKPADFVHLNSCPEDRPAWSNVLLPDEQVEGLRKRLDRGESIAVRSHLTVREKNKPERKAHFDVFLQRNGNEGGRPVFLRDGISISDVRGTRIRGIRSLVVISDKPLAQLLGDAENPAHTQWQSNSSNFKGKYVYGRSYITFVCSLPERLISRLQGGEEEEDRSLLADFFSIPAPEDEEDNRGRRRKVPKKTGGDESESERKIPPPKPRKIRINRVPGGFKVVPAGSEFEGPLLLDIRVAYDSRKGKNPLRRYNRADFILGRNGITLEMSKSVAIIELGENRLQCRVSDKDFEISVQGFDSNRDLYVNASYNKEELE